MRLPHPASTHERNSHDDQSITTVSMPDGDDEDFLTLSEVAAILKVPVNTLRWWRQHGTGPEFFKIGRHLVTTTGDLRSGSRSRSRGAELHNL